jgi:hypothetical protein
LGWKKHQSTTRAIANNGKTIWLYFSFFIDKEKHKFMLNSMHYHKPMKKITPLILSVLMAQSAGLIGTIFTISNIPTWYADAIKPEWTPPSWLFGPPGSHFTL